MLIRLAFGTEEKDAVSVAQQEQRSPAISIPPQVVEDTLPKPLITENTLARIPKEQPHIRKTDQLKKVAPAEKASLKQTEEIMLPENLTTHHEPVRDQSENRGEKVVIPAKIASPVGPEDVQSYLSQTASSDYKSTTTTVTIVFPGKGDSAEATFSRETVKPRRNKILRLFTSGQTEDQTEPAGEPTNIFSILTEKKQ